MEDNTNVQVTGTQQDNNSAVVQDNAQQTVSATPENQPAPNNNDGLSFNIADYETEPGTTDWNKIQDLVKQNENLSKSARYYQSKFMQKNDIPEKVEDYAVGFRPDSSYESVMDDETTKALQSEIYNFAHEKGIGIKNAQDFFDFMMQQAVKNGVIDNRTEEQKRTDEKNFQERLTLSVTPYLNSIHRSRQENDLLMDEFINGTNPFATNDTIRDMMKDIARTPEGYAFISEVRNYFNGMGIPSGNDMTITSSASNGDYNDYLTKLANARNGEETQRIMDEYYNRNKYTPQ